MHALATFARNNSVGWMFVTVILGAVLILSGWLPLQLLGMVLIVAGVATPIMLTGQSPHHRRSTGTLERHQQPENGSPASIPAEKHTRRKSPEIRDPIEYPPTADRN